MAKKKREKKRIENTGSLNRKMSIINHTKKMHDCQRIEIEIYLKFIIKKWQRKQMKQLENIEKYRRED